MSTLLKFLKGNPKPIGNCIVYCKSGGHARYEDYSWRYSRQAFCHCLETSDYVNEKMNERRKELYDIWQKLMSDKKIAGKRRDVDSAKYLKKLESEYRKLYKGTCMAIGHITDGELSGDCPYIEIKDIPTELFFEVDLALHSIYLFIGESCAE